MRFALLSLPLALAACGGGGPGGGAGLQTSFSVRRNLTPPGPPEDPWGPYIREASARFGVPDRWIRAVIRQESGGHAVLHGEPITNASSGAMGLMQLMPATYDEMRVRYNLGQDAFEPHDNILAGTAYLREMYDQFGTPGFLAAYNAGPNRLQDYLENHRSLPDETRRYVFLIGSRLGDTHPQSRSPAEQVALNQIPVVISAGLRYPPPPRRVMVAARGRRHGAAVQLAANTRHAGQHVTVAAAPVEVAEAPELRRVTATGHAAHGLSLVSSAMAAESLHPGGSWAVQIGAYGNAHQAQQAAGAAHSSVGRSNTQVAAVHSGHGTVYRARLSGMSHDAAVQACAKLAHKTGGCILVAPSAQ